MYEYLWPETVLDKLAAIYIAADVPARDRMAAGIEHLNARLAADPLDVGESRVGGHRVAFVPLLVVYYHVDEAHRRVLVTDVVCYGR